MIRKRHGYIYLIYFTDLQRKLFAPYDISFILKNICKNFILIDYVPREILQS